MADISSYERKQNGNQKATSGGDIRDRNEVKSGKSNFRGPSASKSGPYVAPKASGSPWSYGRSSQAEADYAKDYSRRGSSAGKSVNGPKSPSAAIPDVIHGKSTSGSRGPQTRDHK